MRNFMNSLGSMPSTMMSKLVVRASKYRFTRRTRSSKKASETVPPCSLAVWAIKPYSCNVSLK